jgi:hypothetical protein
MFVFLGAHLALSFRGDFKTDRCHFFKVLQDKIGSALVGGSTKPL